MPAVAASVAAYLASSVLGAVIAIRDGEAARFAGMDLSTGDVLLDFLVGAGTGLCAPLALLAVLAGATTIAFRTPAALWLVALVGAGFLIGQVGEAVTWRTLADPLARPLYTLVVVANLVLAPVVGALAYRELRARRASR